jgi:DNA-binding NarL/FixJ family response regulator
MNSNRRIAVVAHRHDLFQLVLVTILQAELGFSEVAVAISTEDVVTHLADADDTILALLDLRMLGFGEAGRLLMLRECFPNARLVAVGPMQRANVLEALAAGVHGYISPEMNIQDLSRALSTVLDGQIFVPVIVTDLPHTFGPPPSGAAPVSPVPNPPRRFSGPGRAEIDLTQRQRDVLRLVIQGQSNRQIAATLGLRESTVKAHLANVFRLLGVRNRSGAAGLGMRMLGREGGLP